MAIAPQKCILEQNFQLPTPLKFGSLVFQMSTEMQNWCQPLWKNGKYGRRSPKMHPRAKLPITNPPKVWISGFPSVDGNAKLMFSITENGKNGCSSPKTHPRAKLLISDPPKVWVSGFPSVNGNAKLVSAITENGKNGHSSPKTHPRAKLRFSKCRQKCKIGVDHYRKWEIWL